MTGQVRPASQKCIEIINNIKEREFPDECDVSDDDLDVSTFTSVWKNPERLHSESDNSLLLATLCREIHAENYNQTLRICKIMKKHEPDNKEIDKVFNYLLMHVLRLEKHKKIDLHILLEWLFSGDREFDCDIINKESYAHLKFYFLCRNRISKYECFSCGCIQKKFIEFYTEDSNKRLMGALTSLIKSSSSKQHPIVQSTSLIKGAVQHDASIIFS
uniref:DUF2695 domain-containing protein n=1 Tax=Caenorhabditis tropicalis TaxID=1561998 RepID=A0A1I7T549_9PELO